MGFFVDLFPSRLQASFLPLPGLPGSRLGGSPGAAWDSPRLHFGCFVGCSKPLQNQNQSNTKSNKTISNQRCSDLLGSFLAFWKSASICWDHFLHFPRVLRFAGVVPCILEGCSDLLGSFLADWKGAPICCGGFLHFGRVLGFARFGGPEIRFLEAFLG